LLLSGSTPADLVAVQVGGVTVAPCCTWFAGLVTNSAVSPEPVEP